MIREERGGAEWQLLSGKTAPFFSGTRLIAQDEVPVRSDGFYIGVVTRGQGMLSGGFGDIPLRRGDSFVCCAAVADHAVTASGDEPLEIVRCLPPEA